MAVKYKFNKEQMVKYHGKIYEVYNPYRGILGNQYVDLVIPWCIRKTFKIIYRHVSVDFIEAIKRK